MQLSIPKIHNPTGTVYIILLNTASIEELSKYSQHFYPKTDIRLRNISFYRNSPICLCYPRKYSNTVL